MKVVIRRVACDNLLVKAYSCLKRYEKDYIAEDTYSDKYYSDNTIVTEMNETEFWALVKELSEIVDVIIGRRDMYDKKNYGIDATITLYDDYLG